MLALIFSKDRAYQLDGLLRSLELHGMTDQLCHLHVIAATSTAREREQYHRVALDHQRAGFVFENDGHGVSFAELVRRELTSHPRVMLLTDDTIFTHQVDLRTVERLLDEPEVLGVSLRLGRNTTRCWMVRDAQGEPSVQMLPEFVPNVGGALAYRWPGADLDFGYSFDLSSSCYRTEDLLSQLQRPLRGPNHMEDTLWQSAHEFIDHAPWLACFETSLAFACPWNRTANDPAYQGNQVGHDPETSAQTLADAFDRGERLDVEQYRGLVTESAHQIVPKVVPAKGET